MCMAEHEKLRGLLESFYEDKESYESNVARLRRKVSKGLIYETVSISEFDDMVKNIEGKKSPSLLESILDPVRKERAPFLFGKDEKLLPEVHEWLVKKAEEAINERKPDVKRSDIIMYGSSTGFQYLDTSDVDMQIRVDVKEEDIFEVFGHKLLDLGKLLDNKMNPVSLFIVSSIDGEDINDTKVTDKYENMYNVTKNEWMKKTGKSSVEVPYKYIMELSEFFMSALDLSISEFERAVRELNRYKGLNPDREDISEVEKNRAVDEAFKHLKISYDKLRLGKSVIIAFDNVGYVGREFKISVDYNIGNSPRLSANTAIRKMIEKFGYLDRITSMVEDGKKIIEDHEKEIEEYRAKTEEKNNKGEE